MIYLSLLLSFMQVGALSFGGGYAAIPLIQAQVVSHNWMTLAEFTDLISIAEMTPGPIAINSATFVGIRIAGIPGAIVASFGVIIPSCFVVSALAILYKKYKGLPLLESVLACVRPVVVALILSAGLSILSLLVVEQVDIPALVIFAVSVIWLRWKKPNPIAVLLSSGVIYLLVSMIAGV